MLQPWHDRKILPGETWNKEIDDHLRKAELVLLLVSKDFVASDYIWSTELEIAMQRHGSGEARVVPVLVRTVDIGSIPQPRRSRGIGTLCAFLTGRASHFFRATEQPLKF
jgi:internalin A